MGRILQQLREIIARNISAERMRKFPGRGGGKQCAEAFSGYIGKNVSPQQWSPWGRGMRTPDETRLEQIATFFGRTVAFMRRDNHAAVSGAPSPALDRINAAIEESEFAENEQFRRYRIMHNCPSRNSS